MKQSDGVVRYRIVKTNRLIDWRRVAKHLRINFIRTWHYIYRKATFCHEFEQR